MSEIPNSLAEWMASLPTRSIPTAFGLDDMVDSFGNQPDQEVLLEPTTDDCSPCSDTADSIPKI